MKLRVVDVFTPGAFPTHTYVERAEDRLEKALSDALATDGQITSLSGPSKAGKTVLVERVVGQENLITVTGAGIRNPEQIWSRVLDWMNAPGSTTSSTSSSSTANAEGTFTAKAGIPGVIGGEGAAKFSGGTGRGEEEVATFERHGLTQVVKEIAKSDYVVLIDDFHYMPREAQVEVAKIIKEAARLGVKICAAAVHHRGDDVIRANPELRGRVRTIDLKYWNRIELARIANAGFAALNVTIPKTFVDKFTGESAGSPQLMQLICLNACFVANIRERLDRQQHIDQDATLLSNILEQTSSSTDFRSLVDILDAGPKTRGTERKMYKFQDGTEGDVYRVILRAVATDPPRLSFDYDELTKRVSAVCKGEIPVGSSLIGTCLHMSRLAVEKFPTERAIDWDEQKQILDIPDPYLLFYLRWSGRLRN